MKIRLTIFLPIISSLSLFGFGQSHNRIIQIDQKSIDLDSVDLENGALVKESAYRIGTDSVAITNYHTQVKVFKSIDLENYAVVYDTSSYSKANEDGYSDSYLRYFTSSGSLLFEKPFKGFEVFHIYISSSGELVVEDIINMDANKADFYNSYGELLKSYSNENERLYAGPLHKHFFICTNDEYEGPNNYDLIDNKGNIQEVTFPTGFLRGIFFSPQENYYVVLIDLNRLLYDINNNLVWKQSQNNMGAINITYDDKKYLVYNFNNSSIEIRDLISRSLISIIDNVIYKKEKIPIYNWNIIDSTFYTVGKNKGKFIFNFYNTQCEIIQTESIEQKILGKKYVVKNESGKYVIKSPD